MQMLNLNYNKIDNVVLANVETKDYPDFCNAYIESADYKGKPMTDAQLDILNDDSDYVYDKVISQVF